MKGHSKKQTLQSETADAPLPSEAQEEATADRAEGDVGNAAGAPQAQPAPNASADEAPPTESKPAVDPMMERLMRLQADFENFRKRVARERAQMAQQAAEHLVKDLLPVLDHFELALKSAAEHGTSRDVLDGLELVGDEIMGVLAKHGLAAVRAEPGAAFDPMVHEAVAHIPSDEIPADAIIEQTRSGYRLGEKLLRPAQVVVSSGPASPPAAES